MALLFIDSFDHYNNGTDLDLKWDSSTVIDSVLTAGGRFGGGCAELDGSSDGLRYALSDETTVILAGAVRMDRVNDAMDSGSVLMTFVEAGVTTNIAIGNEFGKCVVKRGTETGTELGRSSDVVFRTATWHFIEARVTLSNTVGVVVVNVDGVEVINLTNQDTINGGAGVIDLIGYKTLSSIDTRWDDIYIKNDSTFLGDSRIDVLMPDGAGNYSETGTQVGSANRHENVDEQYPDDDTTYNQSTAANQRDTFTMDNLAAITTQTIHGVQQFNWAKHDGTATNHRTKLRISSTDYDGASQALASTYDWYLEMWTQDPNAGPGAWTESVINGMESGYESL